MFDDTAAWASEMDTPHNRKFVRDVLVHVLVEGKPVSVARVCAITGMSAEWVEERIAEAHALLRDKRAVQSQFEALDEAYRAAPAWSDVPLFEVPERVSDACTEPAPASVAVDRPVCTGQELESIEEEEDFKELVKVFEQPEQAVVEPAKADGRGVFRRKSLAEKRFSRQQRFAHKLDLLGDKGNYVTSATRIRGQVERAKLHSRGESAYARRRVETAPHVLADRLTRQRRRATVIAGLMIVGAMAFTSVNVHEFIAGTAPDWTALWVTGWLVDPVLTGLVVWLLWTRSDMAAVNLPISKEREPFIYRVMIAVELITLAATIVMNVIPELSKNDTDPGRVVIHIFIPLVGVGAIFALPYVQSFYADRINTITGAGNAASAKPVHHVQTPCQQGKDLDNTGLSERVQIGVIKVREAIESGKLEFPLQVGKVEDFIRAKVGKCSVPTAQKVVKYFQNEAPELTAN